MRAIDKQGESAVTRPGRPRDPAIDDEVRAAARMLLAEGGYRALTFDSISQRTGIPRSMIYRRWPSKAHLANDIAIGGEAHFPDVIDSEGLAAQIGALVAQIHARYQMPDIAAASVGVIADTQGDRSLQDELRRRAGGVLEPEDGVPRRRQCGVDRRWCGRVALVGGRPSCGHARRRP